MWCTLGLRHSQHLKLSSLTIYMPWVQRYIHTCHKRSTHRTMCARHLLDCRGKHTGRICCDSWQTTSSKNNLHLSIEGSIHATLSILKKLQYKHNQISELQFKMSTLQGHFTVKVVTLGNLTNWSHSIRHIFWNPSTPALFDCMYFPGTCKLSTLLGHPLPQAPPPPIRFGYACHTLVWPLFHVVRFPLPLNDSDR